MKEEDQNRPVDPKTEERARKRAKRNAANRLSNIILFLILVVGMAIMLYPTVSDWWNSFHQSRAVASYVEAVENMNTEEEEAMLEAARAYNAGLPPGVRLLLEDDEYAEYLEMLDITGTGIMGYIQIPAIDVDLPIYHGTDESVLQVATGHLAGTSLPVGGEGTHSVISGHRGLPSARLFTDLDELTEGDSFTITVLNQTVTYAVDQIRIVLPEEVDDLAIEPGKDYCTLVTCTPYGVNTHRMLVRGRRVADLPEEVVVTPDAVKFDPRLVMPAIAIPILFVLLVIMLIVYRRKPAPRSKQEILAEFRKKQ